VEAYIDDIVVCSQKEEGLLVDLQETFENLRHSEMALNPEKCTFSVRSGKLLGYLVSQRRIEVNLEKIWAIKEMKPLATTREAQRLTGCFVAVRRFISRSAEWSVTFFKALRESNPFKWTEEQQQAFQLLREYLQNPETLVSPAPQAPLLLYIATSTSIVSATKNSSTSTFLTHGRLLCGFRTS
jgi:hypothetical protein